ncbi:MAG: ATP synthase F0 subunit B [Ruminococcaceae bacterium]|nr:ATP synthase F0 subunit B [Oscillospiraceae bacterium]
MDYSLLDLITMLDEVVRKAKPVPLSKNSMVDVAQIDEIATEMRLVLPKEIQQAQNVVADKNRILSDAKREAEEIIRRAEQRRNELLDQNAIMKEARKRATEEISNAQARSNLIRTSTNEFTDKMLARVEELLAKDINNLRIMRKTLNSGNDITIDPNKQAQKPPQQVKK